MRMAASGLETKLALTEPVPLGFAGRCKDHHLRDDSEILGKNSIRYWCCPVRGTLFPLSAGVVGRIDVEERGRRVTKNSWKTLRKR